MNAMRPFLRLRTMTTFIAWIDKNEKRPQKAITCNKTHRFLFHCLMTYTSPQMCGIDEIRFLGWKKYWKIVTNWAFLILLIIALIKKAIRFSARGVFLKSIIVSISIDFSVFSCLNWKPFNGNIMSNQHCKKSLFWKL